MKLENAKERGFEVDGVDSIQVGDFVKICSKGERFWVEVKQIDGNTYFGSVSNELIYSDITSGSEWK